MTTKVRVLFYDLQLTAGIQTAIKNLCSRADSLGLEIEIVLGSLSCVDEKAFPGCKFVDLGLSITGRHTLWRRFLYPIAYFMKYGFNRNKRMKIIDYGTFCWLFDANIIGYRHFGLINNKKGQFMANMVARFAPDREIWVLTDVIADHYKSLGFRNVSVVPNFINEEDVNRFTQLNANRQERLKVIDKNVKTVVAGRFAHQKGFDRLPLSNEPPFYIDAYINYEGEIEYPFTNSPLRSKIFVLPSLTTIEVLSSYDIIIMPSRYEGLPFLAVEMILSGVPVFHSGCDGFNDIMEQHFQDFYIDFESISCLDEIHDRFTKLDYDKFQALQDVVRAKFTQVPQNFFS